MRPLVTAAVAFALMATLPSTLRRAEAHGGTYAHAYGDPHDPKCADPPPDCGPICDPESSPTPTGRAPGAKKVPNFANWTQWWDCNKDAFLEVRPAARLIASGPRSSDTAFGRRPASEPALRITRAAVAERVTPVLRRLLADDELSFHIRSASALALAKIGDESATGLLLRMARNEDHEFHREVEETAVLALGYLGRASPEVRLFLLDLATGDRGGTFARPFAAVSLGLLAVPDEPDRATIAALFARVTRAGTSADVRQACLLAIGLAADGDSIPELLAMLRSGKASPGGEELSNTDLAFVVTALAKIGLPGWSSPDVVDELLRSLASWSRSGVEVRRACALALGTIGPRCTPLVQRRLVAELERLAEDAADEQVRHFATISEGRLAAAHGVDPALRANVVAAVRERIESGDESVSSYAALALGLVAHAAGPDDTLLVERTIRAPLRRRFDDSGSPNRRSALATAIGLAADPLAETALLNVLLDRGQTSRLRAPCALALGMIGARGATLALRTTLHEERDRNVAVHCALAAALLGDASVEDELFAELQDHDASLYDMSTATVALGRLGDERALGPLLDIAADADSRYPDLSRALAVVALGQIGDKSDAPTLARLKADLDYRAPAPFLVELLTIL